MSDIQYLKLMLSRVIKFDDLHPVAMKKIKSDEYLNNILKFFDGDIAMSAGATVAMLRDRDIAGVNSLICNISSDELYSKTIKHAGKDHLGLHLLFIDMTELQNLESDKQIFDDLFYWFERMDRREDAANIAMAIHHGEGKNMEKTLPLLEILVTLMSIYFGFVNTIYFFEDCMSRNCHDFVEQFFRKQISKFINESNYKLYLKLYDTFEMKDGSLNYVPKSIKKVKGAQKRTMDPNGTPKQIAQDIAKAKQHQTIEQGVTKNNRDNMAAKLEDNETKIHSKQSLKNILVKLHDLENNVFELIRDVQNLI